jgi:hypothetical protein
VDLPSFFKRRTAFPKSWGPLERLLEQAAISAACGREPYLRSRREDLFSTSFPHFSITQVGSKCILLEMFLNEREITHDKISLNSNGSLLAPFCPAASTGLPFRLSIYSVPLISSPLVCFALLTRAENHLGLLFSQLLFESIQPLLRGGEFLSQLQILFTKLLGGFKRS